MQSRILFAMLLFLLMACQKERSEKSDLPDPQVSSETKFDSARWRTREGSLYPYREGMVDDIVYNDTIRDLNRNEIIEMLGKPDYARQNYSYLYYRISEKRLGILRLHTKTMVIKFLDDQTVDWIKIHE